MSDKISLWWIRLYPASFREQYGSEMLLLIRDRMREETGSIARLRVWSDLLIDVAISLPRTWLYRPAVVGINEGSLSFRLIEDTGPSPLIYVLSAIASLLVLHFVQGLHTCTCMSEARSSHVVTGFHAMLRGLFR